MGFRTSLHFRLAKALRGPLRGKCGQMSGILKVIDGLRVNTECKALLDKALQHDGQHYVMPDVFLSLVTL